MGKCLCSNDFLEGVSVSDNEGIPEWEWEELVSASLSVFEELDDEEESECVCGVCRE